MSCHQYNCNAYLCQFSTECVQCRILLLYVPGKQSITINPSLKFAVLLFPCLPSNHRQVSPCLPVCPSCVHTQGSNRPRSVELLHRELRQCQHVDSFRPLVAAHCLFLIVSQPIYVTSSLNSLQCVFIVKQEEWYMRDLQSIRAYRMNLLLYRKWIYSNALQAGVQLIQQQLSMNGRSQNPVVVQLVRLNVSAGCQYSLES